MADLYLIGSYNPAKGTYCVKCTICKKLDNINEPRYNRMQGCKLCNKCWELRCRAKNCNRPSLQLTLCRLPVCDYHKQCNCKKCD